MDTVDPALVPADRGLSQFSESWRRQLLDLRTDPDVGDAVSSLTLETLCALAQVFRERLDAAPVVPGATVAQPPKSKPASGRARAGRSSATGALPTRQPSPAESRRQASPKVSPPTVEPAPSRPTGAAQVSFTGVQAAPGAPDSPKRLASLAKSRARREEQRQIYQSIRDQNLPPTRDAPKVVPPQPLSLAGLAAEKQVPPQEAQASGGDEQITLSRRDLNAIIASISGAMIEASRSAPHTASSTRDQLQALLREHGVHPADTWSTGPLACTRSGYLASTAPTCRNPNHSALASP